MAVSIRAVLFDAVGTILRPDPTVAVVYADVGRRCGCEVKPAETAARFAKAFRDQEQLDRDRYGWRTDNARERERWKSIVGDVLGDRAQRGQPFELLWEHFGQPASWRLDPAYVSLQQRLADHGIAVGLASNFDARLHTVARGFAPLASCPIFISTELGWRKPALEFFREIERQLRLPPGEILLVGDDLANDYEAARHAGWQAVLIDSEQPPGIDAVASLTEFASRFD